MTYTHTLLHVSAPRRHHQLLQQRCTGQPANVCCLPTCTHN